MDNENDNGEAAGLTGIPARGQARIKAHAARLFNEGLAAALEGRPAAARDRFAAFVYWYPHDLEARSALALACWESGDREEARGHWERVLSQRPGYETARRGMALLSAADDATDEADDAPDEAEDAAHEAVDNADHAADDGEHG
ncbi:MAG: hypothetical protein ACJ786_23240, partial [Catenulispora sp.]